MNSAEPSVPEVIPFYDEATFTFTYLVIDPSSGRAAIIDPVLDYDPASRRIGTHSAERVLGAVAERGLAVDWILETHAHADHLTAAEFLKLRLAGAPRVGIGAGIQQVQTTFKEKLSLEPDFPTDGRQFDRLFQKGDSVSLGALTIAVLDTPGHTPDSVSYLVGDAVFVGDTLFAPYYGTARCDFPGGDARQLYASMQKLLALPATTRIFLCHDYPPEGHAPQYESNPRAQREQNIHLKDGIDEASFVAMRRARDATLKAPRLLEASLRVNVRAGRLEDPHVTEETLS
jgi:glyoxylase-like metal-dependent hydrolase (beta-lactamase superfamily II)